jgi:DGQHR domain-containing protein
MSIFKEAYQNCEEAQSFDEIELTKTSFKKPKGWKKKETEWEQFEDDTKEFFINLGASHVNFGNFNFDLSEYECPQNKRQIDVIALINNRFLIISECKHTSNSKSRAVSGAFEKIQTYKGHIKRRIKKIFREDLDIQPIWVMNTSGIELQSEKKKQFLENDVITITELEKDYFQDCVDTSSSSEFAFNQFLGLFKNRSNYYENKTYGVIKTERNALRNKHAYTFAITANDMIPISYVAHKRAENIYSDTTNSYQRVLTKARLKNIAKHIDESKTPFINNVLVSFRGKKNTFKTNETGLGQGRTELLNFKHCPGTFHVIDGQHRLFSYCGVDNKALRNQVLLITAFKDLTEEEEARIFLDVNQKQKNVDPGLLLEVQLIFGESTTGDKQIENLATSILLNLREDKDSPFDTGMIPPAEKKGLLPLRTLNKDAMTKGMLLGRNKDFTNGYLAVDNNFRKTVEFSTQLFKNYFQKIKDAIPRYWIKERHNSALKTNFIGGLILLLNRMIRVAFGDEKIDHKKIEEKISKYVDYLCEQLENINEDQRTIHFDWVHNGRKGLEGQMKMPLARSLLIKDFLKEKFPELWMPDDENNCSSADEEFNKDELEAAKKPLLDKIEALEKELKKNFTKEKEAIILEKILRRYIHQILKDHFKSEQSEQFQGYEEYWDKLSVHRLNFTANNPHPYDEALKNNLEMRRRYEENGIFKPYRFLISHCNYLSLLKILKIIRNHIPELWDKVSNAFEIIDYDSYKQNQQSSKDKSLEAWIRFFNELRNYEGGGHTGYDEDDVPSNTPLAEEMFVYYKAEFEKRLKILKNIIN